MKILLVCPDWFPYSAGLGQSAFELASQMKKNGHEVTIATADRGNHDNKGFKLIEVPLMFIMLGRNPICHSVYKTLKKEIKEADVVLLFSYMFELNSRIAMMRMLRIIKKPVIHMYRGSLENYGLKGIALSTKIGKWLWDNTCAWFILRSTDATISNSGPTLNYIKDKYKTPKKRLFYVKTGMYLDQFKVSKCNNKRVMFQGRLIDNKGVCFFEDIIKIIPKDWTFSIAGNGPKEEYVKKLAKKHKNVEYVGKLPYDKLKQLISKSDINILPTFAEGSPRAVLDAACSGVASICFDVGDVPNTIPKGTGYVIDRYDIDDFCKKLDSLIKNPKRVKQWGKNARKFAENELDWNIIYKRTFNAIKKVIKMSK